MGGFGETAVDDGDQGLPGLALAPLAAFGDLAQQVDERGGEMVDVEGEGQVTSSEQASTAASSSAIFFSSARAG